MAPLLFKEMKGVNFSCASPASAAICTSIDRKSMVRPSTGRVIDRHTPHLRDPQRAKTTVNSMNQAHTRSKSYREKSRRSLSLEDTAADELLISTPPGSARYVLNDEAFIDVFPGLKVAQPPRAPLSIELDGPKASKKEDCTPVFKPCPSTGKKDQVVVLRVSLHCKGCEGKVRKHISRMEGVTSFDIDFASKKVTVVGDVTPLGVLNSLSKVKNAQLWPSPWSPPQP